MTMTFDWSRLLILFGCLACSGIAGTTRSQQVLDDAGFEDPVSVDNWSNLYGTPDTDFNATIMPRTGDEHLSVVRNSADFGFGPYAAQFVTAGFENAAGVPDFSGLTLRVESYHKVVENELRTTEGTAGVYAQMYLGYYNGGAFLGYSNVLQPEGLDYILYTDTTADYVKHSYLVTVPDATPVTGFYFVLSAVIPSPDYTGTATIYFDDASVTVVIPEPSTFILMGFASCSAIALIRRRRIGQPNILAL